MSALVTILVTYFVKYDPELNTDGLTVYSLKKAKEMFKGSKINDREGEKIVVDWKLKDSDEDVIYFSQNDMKLWKLIPGTCSILLMHEDGWADSNPFTQFLVSRTMKMALFT
jgi:hypothetical protein